MIQSRTLRRAAGDLARPFPPLLAQAEKLAATTLLGEHGRRRAGMGDEFWQYRVAVPGDSAHQIDWRRSAKSDTRFVRQKEWQALQTVFLWVDRSPAMNFSSSTKFVTKGERAQVLALAMSILLIRAGEKVGLADSSVSPGASQAQVIRLAEALCEADQSSDYGVPRLVGLKPYQRGILLSDFMGDLEPVKSALSKAVERGVKGAILQVLDPAEESFPFDGRTIFESMSGSIRHETLKAGDLRQRYLDRLAERKAELAALARASGWLYHCHHTGDSPSGALLWLYAATERRKQ